MTEKEIRRTVQELRKYKSKDKYIVFTLDQWAKLFRAIKKFEKSINLL
jgi:hypothetical protein